jgi:FMN-dependent NADH-azoreductase
VNRVLLVLSSPRGAPSYSSRVARALAERLSGGRRDLLTVRDLGHQPLAHIDANFVVGRDMPPEQRTPAQRIAIELSDRLIAEVFAADVLVIASAMINFGISSNLKAWIDHLARAGLTFRYSDQGPEGLIKGKKVYIVKASGGVYSQGPMVEFNFQDTYLRRLLGFLGMTDVETIGIEGVAFGADAAERAVSAALTQVSAVEAA